MRAPSPAILKAFKLADQSGDLAAAWKKSGSPMCDPYVHLCLVLAPAFRERANYFTYDDDGGVPITRGCLVVVCSDAGHRFGAAALVWWIGGSMHYSQASGASLRASASGH